MPRAPSAIPPLIRPLFAAHLSAQPRPQGSRVKAKAAPLRSASNQKRSKRRPPFHERRCKVTGRKEDRRASRCVPYRCEGDRRACVLCVCAPPPQRPACCFCSRHGSPWRRACAGAACGATTERLSLGTDSSRTARWQTRGTCSARR